jgi:membrane protein implicated in regulation of membrane protease activity
MLPKNRIARVVLIAVVAALLFSEILGEALLQTIRGHGADTYANVYGMQIHWVTVLTLAASLLVAFVTGLIVRRWQRRDDRTIDRLLASKMKDES